MHSTWKTSGVDMSKASELRNPEQRDPLRPALVCCLSELPRMAEAQEHGLVAASRNGGDVRLADRAETAASPDYFYSRGSQDIHKLSEDLALVRSDFSGFSPVRINLDVRGLLYLHFRLEGLSEEDIPGMGPRRLGRECFILSATSRPRFWVRELVGDAWRTVGIVCRAAAFAEPELQWLGKNLPEELRRFRSEEEFEFAFVGDLSPEMRGAVQSLMRTRMPREIRDTYLRSKVVELVCLALARIRGRSDAEPAASPPIRLNSRDIDAIRCARSLLLAIPSAPALGALARRVGINRNKLAFGFKSMFGVTIGEFDRTVRLERARSLLQREHLPIRRVASLAGYEDPGSFSKAFKLEYGVLPSELRGMETAKVTEARFFGTDARRGNVR
jgi:AraC-like DNA-binding protein